MRLGISLSLAAILAISILLAPVAPLSGVRQRLADLAFDAGLDRIGYNLILVSANTNDPRALNNLGALLFWGKGTQKRDDEAIVTFRDAIPAGRRGRRPHGGARMHGAGRSIRWSCEKSCTGRSSPRVRAAAQRRRSARQPRSLRTARRAGRRTRSPTNPSARA